MYNKNEKLFDAMLKIAAEESVIQETDSMPDTAELNKLYPRNDILDKKIMETISEKSGRYNRHRTSNTCVTIAACFVILFVMGTAALFSLHFTTIIRPQTVIDLTDLVMESAEFFFDIGDPIAFPEGYKYLGRMFLENMTITTYVNADNEEVHLREHFETDIVTLLAARQVEFSLVQINGREVYLFDATDYDDLLNMVVWSEGDTGLEIISGIDVNELLEIVGYIAY